MREMKGMELSSHKKEESKNACDQESKAGEQRLCWCDYILARPDAISLLARGLEGSRNQQMNMEDSGL